MIVYGRELKREDIASLGDYEELIYYKSESIAITITQIDDFYIVRKKKISNNELVEDLKLHSIDEILEFALN